MTDGLCRLLAPLLCHSADEAFRALHKKTPDDPSCVHLEAFPTPTHVTPDPSWPAAFAARSAALVAVEKSKAAPAEGGLGIDNPLDCGVVLPDPDGALARFDPVDLADLLNVSRVTFDRAATAPRILDLRSEPRCDRSWKRDGTVKRRSDGGMLSDRDAAALGVV